MKLSILASGALAASLLAATAMAETVTYPSPASADTADVKKDLADAEKDARKKVDAAIPAEAKDKDREQAGPSAGKDMPEAESQDARG
jgi:hypothetical protein